jgi:hypothetical protein
MNILYHTDPESEFTAILSKKSTILDWIADDIWRYEGERGKYNIINSDNFVNIYIGDDFYSPDCGETKKNFKLRYGMSWREVLSKADYIEWINTETILIWSKDKTEKRFNKEDWTYEKHI